MLKKVQ